MHGISLTAGELYYGQTRHRVDVPLDAAIRKRVADLCHDLHSVFNSGSTPLPKAKNCKLCSLKDICIPELAEAPSVAAYYAGYLKEVCNTPEQEES